ncbi:hypothetical protein L7F22_009405 [Adiantum nelumboides]|nr:hypothetical protein [Adiantum nelumboides]
MSDPIDPQALLAQLTLEEKIQLTSGSDLWRTFSIERLKVPFIKLTDGPIGARGGGDFHDSTPSTLFPSPSCLGSTWDRELAFEMGKQIALDSIEKQCHVLLGPTINGQRDPRAGRFFESYSEDPTLMGYLASSWIQGAQSCGVGATMKHFIANEAEYDRRNNSSDLSIETLREVYLEPFRIIMADMQRLSNKNNDDPFKSQPACVMTAYNRVNGVSSSENDEMITDILRKEWKFDGLVMSDWFAMHANAFNATDLEMPGPTIHRTISQTIEKIEKGDEEGKDWESEGFDRSNILLPRRQDDLVNQITKSSPGKTIILNLTGSVVEMPWIKDATGIVQCWYGGQEGAESLSDILLARGEAPASGRLAHVWPAKIEDHPTGTDESYFPGIHLPNDKQGPHTNYVEGRLVGYKFYNKNKNSNQPAFHFGQGLGGYTSFLTQGPFLEKANKINKSTLPISLKVKSTNNGKRSGKEVIQIYLRPHIPLTDAKDEPIQRLVAFTVLRPSPDQTEEANLQLYQDAFSYWDEKNRSWQVKQGDYDLVLARSARYGDELGKVIITIDQSWSWTGTGVE